MSKHPIRSLTLLFSRDNLKVNTIFNSACQCGKRWRRSPSLLGGLERSPSRPRFWGHLGVNGTHFWIALTPFSTRRDRLASAEGALPRYWGLGWSPSRHRFWEHLGAYGTRFWIALTPFSIILAPTAGLQHADPIMIVPFSDSRISTAANDTGACRLTHMGDIGHVHQNVGSYVILLHRGAKNVKRRQNSRLRLLRAFV